MLLPATLPLSRKLLSWKLQLLEARYCVNRCQMKIERCWANIYYETWGKPDIVYFISIAHEVMGRDQWLEDDDPIGVLRPLDQQIGQLRNGNIGLVGAMQQICNRPEKNKNFNAINKTTTKMKIKQRNPDINYPFICFHPDFPHYCELKKSRHTWSLVEDRYVMGIELH
jgi:hypothetical protein